MMSIHKTGVGLRAFSIALLLFVLSPLARAHQQWLAPNFFFETGERAWVSFDHTFSDRRFHAGFSPGSYYQWWVVDPDGIRQSVPHLYLGKTRVVGEVELEAQGTYRLEGEEAEMAWTQISLDNKKVWQPGTRQEFKDAEVVTSRLYFNQALAYVSLGLASRGPLAPSGAPLEIQFLDHPNTLVAGKDFRVNVLSEGQGLAEQVVEVFADGGSAHDAVATQCTTAADGSCKLGLPSAGRYLIVTSTQGDFEKPVETDSFSYIVTVMIEVVETR